MKIKAIVAGAMMLGISAGGAQAFGSDLLYTSGDLLYAAERDMARLLSRIWRDDDEEEVVVRVRRERPYYIVPRSYYVPPPTRPRRMRRNIDIEIYDPCEGTGVRGCSGRQYRIRN